MRKNWALAAASLAVTLFALELYFRVFPATDSYTNNPYRYLVIRGEQTPLVPYHSYQHVFPVRYDFHGYYRASDGVIDYHSNQFGARWIDKGEQPVGKRTAILLGDSFTYGFGLRYADTFAYRVHQMLSDVDVALFNFARPAANSVDDAKIYSSQPLPPHQVVIYFLNLNDLIEFPTSYVITSPVGGRIEHSRLLSFVFKRLEAIVGRERRLREIIQPQAMERPFFRDNVKAIATLKAAAAGRGATLYIVILPTLIELNRDVFRPIYEAIKRRLEKESIEYFDLSPTVSGRRDADLWILPFDQHPNDQAASIFAAALAPWLRKIVTR